MAWSLLLLNCNLSEKLNLKNGPFFEESVVLNTHRLVILESLQYFATKENILVKIRNTGYILHKNPTSNHQISSCPQIY